MRAEQLRRPVLAHEDAGVVARVRVDDRAGLRIVEREEERDEFLGARAPEHHVVEARAEQARREMLAGPHLESRLHRGRENRRAHSLSAHVRDDHVERIVPAFEEVVVVARDRARGHGPSEQLRVGKRRLGLGQESALDLPRERHLALDSLARRGALLKAQVLDLDGGRVREGREEAEILLAEALTPEAHLEVDEADDLVFDEERRRHARRDALNPDGFGGSEARVRGGVDEEDAILLVDDRLDERLAEPDVRGIHARRVLHLLGPELALLVRQHQEAPVGLEKREGLLEDELDEAGERNVPEHVHRDLVEHPKRRVEARQLLGPELRIPGRLVRPQEILGGLQERRPLRALFPDAVDDDARRGLLDDFHQGLAELDAVSGREHHGHGDARSVQGRAVARAEVDELDGAPALDALDPRVNARERTVPERHVVRRGAAQSQDRAVEQDSARRLPRHPHIEDEHETKSSNNNRFGTLPKRPARVILRGSGIAYHAAKP